MKKTLSTFLVLTIIISLFTESISNAIDSQDNITEPVVQETVESEPKDNSSQSENDITSQEPTKPETVPADPVEPDENTDTETVPNENVASNKEKQQAMNASAMTSGSPLLSSSFNMPEMTLVSLPTLITADEQEGRYTDGNTIYELDGVNEIAIVVDFEVEAKDAEVYVPEYVMTENGVEYEVTDVDLDMKSQNKSIEKLVLPDTVINVNASKFHQLDALEEVVIPGSIMLFDGTFTKKVLDTYDCCESLKTAIFKEGIEEINCSYLFAESPLTSVTLPTSLVYLDGAEAFKNTQLAGILDLSYLTNLEYIASGVFKDCELLTEVYLPDLVTTLNNSTFENCVNLKNVKSNGTLSKLGNYAFRNCKNLVEVPDLSHVTSMGWYAFANCSKKLFTNGIDLSSLKKIPYGAFYQSYASNIKFSESLESIGDYAFYWGNFKTLELPDTLTTIGEKAFYYCINMPKVINIPDSVIEIGSRAFFNCQNVEEINFGAGIKDINVEEFYGPKTNALKKVTFKNYKDNVSLIGETPEGIECQFVDDEGDDTISFGGKPLQQMIYEAEQGDTIVLEKDVVLQETLIIPETAKNITIKSDGFSISGNSLMGNKNLINVIQGANVIFGGNLLLNGLNTQKSIIYSEGNVVIQDNVQIKNGYLKAIDDKYVHSGIIHVTGPYASLTLAGGVIENNRIESPFSGTILVDKGANLDFSGGTITNNFISINPRLTDQDKNNYVFTSSGILVCEGATGTMSKNAVISNNKSFRGSAIMLYSKEYDELSQFTLTGGLVTGNTCQSYDEIYDDEKEKNKNRPSGAVMIYDNSEFLMLDGSIVSNKGTMGGGVTVLDTRLASNNGEYGTSFIMQNGKIEGNHGRTGGGIYSFSNGVKLYQGRIIQNTAFLHGGGIYSEGNEDVYSTLYIQNAIITENDADLSGGGVWFCPTGDGAIFVEDGAAIYDNESGESAADLHFKDIRFPPRITDSSGYKLTLPNRFLGGGYVKWIRDTEEDRNSQNETPKEVTNIADYSSELSLKTETTIGTKNQALIYGKVIISGNHSDQTGGGIGANGGVIIGNKDPRNLEKITVYKKWDNADKNNIYGIKRPTEITLNLVSNGNVLETRVLNDNNEWQWIFDNLPMKDSDGNDIIYQVTESELEHYTGQVIEITKGDNVYWLENQFTPKLGGFTIKKQTNGNGTNESDTFSFQVDLSEKYTGIFGDLKFTEGKSEIFSLGNNDEVTVSNILAGTTYTIKEVDSHGYVSTVNENSEEVVSSRVNGIQTAVGTAVEGGNPIITFTNTRKVFSIPVKKEWDHTYNFGTLPSEATVQLYYKLGEAYVFVDAVKLNEDNSWKASFTDIPSQMVDGTNYEYYLSEVTVPNYTMILPTGIVANEDGMINVDSTKLIEYVFKNTYVPTYGGFIIDKVVEGSGANENEMFEFTVTLDSKDVQSVDLNKTYGDLAFVDGVCTFKMSAKENGKTVSGLPVGIHYSITETDGHGYYTTVPKNASGIVKASDANGKYDVITFKNVKEVVNIPIEKLWYDTYLVGNKATEVTVRLLDASNNVVQTKTITKNIQTGKWNTVFTNVLVHNEDNEKFVYYIDELPVPHYSVIDQNGKLPGLITIDLNQGLQSVYEIKNVYVPDLGGFTVRKQVGGNGANINDEFSFTVQLTPAIQGTFGDLTFDTTGKATFTLKDGQSKTVSGLPVGIQYEITEAPFDGYTTSVTGNKGSITDEGNPEIIFVNSKAGKEIQVEKTWNHMWNLGDQPTSVTFKLMNGTTEVKRITLTNPNDGSKKWTGVFKDVRIYDDHGEEIIYSVEEVIDGQNEKYTPSYSRVGDVFVVHNEFNQAYGGFTISKTVEGSDIEKKETFKFKVELEPKLNGEFGGVTYVNGESIFELHDGQSFIVTGLPTGVTYTITELGSEGYFTSIGEDAKLNKVASGVVSVNGNPKIVFTNKKGIMDIPVSKVWDHTYNFDEKTFPTSLKLTLKGNPIKDYHLTLSAEDEWTGVFKDVQIYNADGSQIQYYIEEEVVPHYIALDTNGDTVDGLISVVSTKTDTVYEIKNTYVPDLGGFEVKKTVTGTGANESEMFEFTVEIPKEFSGQFGQAVFKDGVARFSLHHNESIIISGLPVGIPYTIEEVERHGYITSVKESSEEVTVENGIVHGNIVENSTDYPLMTFNNHKDYINIPVSKTWNHTFNFNEYPESVIVYLTKDDSVDHTVEPLVLNAENKWKGLFGNLPAHDEYGHYYQYGIQEVLVPHYSSEIAQNEDGSYLVKNTYVPDLGGFTVKKIIDGTSANPEDSFKFKVTLDIQLNGRYGDLEFRDGVAEFTLKADESVIVNQLPADITYTVEEVDYLDYDSMVIGVPKAQVIPNGNPLIIFKNFKELKTEISVKKEWDHTWNDGKIPESVIVYLKDGQEIVEPIELNDSNDWTYIFKNLNVHRTDQKPIQYYIEEALIDHYRVEITEENGVMLIKNTYVPDLGGFTVKKIVSGTAANADDVFAFEVILDEVISGQFGEVFFENGKAKFELKANQTMTISELPVGIEYVIKEIDSKGYMTTINGKTSRLFEGEVGSQTMVIFENHKDNPKKPNTNDSNQVEFALMMMLMSLLSIFVLQRKKRELR